MLWKSSSGVISTFYADTHHIDRTRCRSSISNSSCLMFLCSSTYYLNLRLQNVDTGKPVSFPFSPLKRATDKARFCFYVFRFCVR